MSRESIEQLIEETIMGATGVHKVFSNNIFVIGSMRDDQIKDILDVDDETIKWNFWTLRRVATANEDSNLRPGEIPMGYALLKTHTFEIMGYAAVARDSQTETDEIDFQRVVDAVISAFDRKASLGGRDATPIQLNRMDNMTILNRVCYRANMVIAVTEVENVRRHS